MDALLFHPGNSKTDLQPASKALSPVLGKHPMDLMREFSMTSGILLEELASQQASECQEYLAKEGYKTIVVSQKDVCHLQKPNLVRSLAITNSSLECT